MDQIFYFSCLLIFVQQRFNEVPKEPAQSSNLDNRSPARRRLPDFVREQVMRNSPRKRSKELIDEQEKIEPRAHEEITFRKEAIQVVIHREPMHFEKTSNVQNV